MSDEIKLSDKLTMKKKNIYDGADAEKKEKIFAFAEGYKTFLDMAKTEREASETAVEAAKKYGFTEYKLGDKLAVGDKKYLNNRSKSLFLFRIGENDIEKEGIRILAALLRKNSFAS